jgi:hypothetical protein
MSGDRGRPSVGGFGPVAHSQPGGSPSGRVAPVDHPAHGADQALASWARFSLWTAVTPLRGVGGFYDDRSCKYDQGYIHLPSGLRVRYCSLPGEGAMSADGADHDRSSIFAVYAQVGDNYRAVDDLRLQLLALLPLATGAGILVLLGSEPCPWCCHYINLGNTRAGGNKARNHIHQTSQE